MPHSPELGKQKTMYLQGPSRHTNNYRLCRTFLPMRGLRVTGNVATLHWVKRLLIRTPAHIRFALKAVCAIGLLWLIVGQLDAGAAVNQILGIGRYQLVGALIVLFSLSLPSTIRWSNVLKIVGYPLKFSTIWPIMLVVGFFNQALPSTMGGDIVRMAQGYRAGIPVDMAISNVVLDRLTSFVSLLLLVVMTLPLMFFVHR